MSKSEYCDGKCSGAKRICMMGFAKICGHTVSSAGMEYCGRCAVMNNACQFCGKEHKPETTNQSKPRPLKPKKKRK